MFHDKLNSFSTYVVGFQMSTNSLGLNGKDSDAQPLVSFEYFS